jgi:hypothetical protein
MSKKTEKKINETPENDALTASINAVYQKYGTNLAAFYRDVSNTLTKTHKTSDSRQPQK